MDWCQTAVFLFAGSLTHFIADLLSHKKKRGGFIFLHCFLYAIFFIPLFCWLEINFLWLFLVFFSHLIIDSLGDKIYRLVKFMTREKNEPEKEKEFLLGFIALGTDQALHLSALIIIVVLVF